MKIHSVRYNYVMNTILKMSAFIFPLITFPYVSRVLGVALNGKISFASSYISYFVMVAQLGIPTYGVRICAQNRDNKERLSKIVHELFIINACMTIISYIVLLITVYSIPKLIQNRNLIIILSVTIMLSCLGMEWFYQAIEQYDYITFRNLMFKIISIALMFLFVHDTSDYMIYAGITVIGTVGSNILNFIRIRKYIFVVPFNDYKLYYHLKAILVLFMFTIGATIYTSLDSVMLGFLSTDTEIGYYSAAIKTRNILYSLVTSIGTVLLPRASYLIKSKQYDQFKNIIKKSVQFVVALAVPLTIFFVIESKDSILFLAGSNYSGAVKAMMVITPTIILAGMSNITGIQILIPLGFEKYTVISTFGGAIVDTMINAMLIPKLGATGAAIGTLIAETVVLFIQLYFMHKNKLISFLQIDWLNIIKIILASGISGIFIISVGLK